MTKTDSGGQTETLQSIGGYKIVRKLGRGGMGTVYLAFDSRLDRNVAIKIPYQNSKDNGQIRDRFIQEARSLAAIQHPNICPIFEVGDADGRPFIAMANIDGRAMSEYLKPGKPLKIRPTLLLVRKLALALQHAHSAGIVHRDLKPDNVIIDQRNEPIIMDFGLARRQQVSAERVTVDGQVMGSPQYMSPEQLSGNLNEIDHRSDIYGLGVILYELMTGRLPYESGDLLGLVRQIAIDLPARPSSLRADIHETLDQICMTALEKDPGLRFESMQQFADALTACLRPSGNRLADAPSSVSHSHIDAESVVPVIQTQRIRRHRSFTSTAWLTLYMTLLVGGMLAVLFWLVQRNHSRLADGGQPQNAGQDRDSDSREGPSPLSHFDWKNKPIVKPDFHDDGEEDPDDDEEAMEDDEEHEEDEEDVDLEEAREAAREDLNRFDEDRDRALSFDELLRFHIEESDNENDAREAVIDDLEEFDQDGDEKLSFAELVEKHGE